MEISAKTTVRVDHQKPSRFATRVFEKLGVVKKDAEIAAKVLVMADLRGVDTHGVIRLNLRSWYVKWLRERTMNATPKLRVICENASTALVDGDAGMGMVIGHRAMELAIVADFKRDMDTLIRELKSTTPIEGQKRVLVAGEIEFETAKERGERGIPLHNSVLEGLTELSQQLSIPYDLE